MTYSYKYKQNPSFPYNSSKKTHSLPFDSKEKDIFSFLENSFFSSIFSPIENFLGRKIAIDDILLIFIIYIIFTEKEKENNTLLLCLLFILFS